MVYIQGRGKGRRSGKEWVGHFLYGFTGGPKDR